MSGHTSPLPGDGAPLAGGPSKFSLTFNHGGCGTFLPLFFKLMVEVQPSAQAATSQAAQDGRLSQVAYVDPSDPSVLYLTQPTAAPNSQQTTDFEPSAPPPEPGDVAQQGQGQQSNCILS